MRPASFVLIAGVVAAPAAAGTVSVTIPKQDVAEYHRPYVAIWIEPVGGGAVQTLALWYDGKKAGNEPGTKWLADLRAWWRKGGRSLKMPADGISGATRAPGQYSIKLPDTLKPGQYVLSVEAARETGGRELVSVPIRVPNASAHTTGKSELGTVRPLRALKDIVMKTPATRLFLAAALLSAPTALSAHRLWMLPSATVFSGTGGWVTVDAAASDDLFFFDHQPLRLDGVKVWQPDGSEGTFENGSTGRYRSVFDVKLDKAGTWKIGTQTASVTGSFMVDGVEKRVGGRGGPPPGGGGAGMPGMAPCTPPLTVADIPANATQVKLAEVSSRNEVFVTADEPTRTVFATSGKGLEFDPVTHPDELVAGETATFRFLIDGKPAAGLKVTVIPGGKRYRNQVNEIDVTTGADGVASVKWPAAGMYWLNATATDAKTTTPRATERRMSYATTLEVLTP